MEHWKTLLSLSLDEVAELTKEKRREAVRTEAGADAVYACAHRRVVYRLRSTMDFVYYLPRPVCAECEAEMTIVRLWNRETPDLGKDGRLEIAKA